VIDVHRGEAALVVMRVPERQLLAAMRRTERVVDVEDLNPARLATRGKVFTLQNMPRLIECTRLGDFRTL
jgi:hypothetical protein